MKSLLEEAIQQVKALPEERQNDLGEILMTLVEQDVSEFQLNEHQVREVERRLTSTEPMIPFEEIVSHFNIEV